MMRTVGSRISHPDLIAGDFPESRASTSSRTGTTAHIVPGGDVFALPSSYTAFRSQQRSPSSTTIHLLGEPAVNYRVTHPHSRLPQWAAATDPETGGPLPGGRYVRQNDQGQWMQANVPPATAKGKVGIGLTSVKLAGDPADYVIKNPSNTRTPQPLYRQQPNGDLKQTPKHGIYDGRDGVKQEQGLPGGLDPSDDAVNHRINQAHTRLADAQQNAGEAEIRVTQRQQEAHLAHAAAQHASERYEQARADYLRARADYVAFRDSQAPSSPLTEAATHEMERLAEMEEEAEHRVLSTSALLEETEAAYFDADARVAQARSHLAAWQEEVVDARAEVYAAEHASY